VIAPFQLLARLRTKHPARDAPGPEGRLLAIVAARRPLTGEQTVLPVIAQAQGSDGKPWLEVRLPGRPLRGKVLAPTGWIRAMGTVARRTAWHIVVNTTHRRASVFFRGRQVRRFRVIVGKPSTPTPLGEFFVEENVLMPAAAAGAPYALATSARSGVLQEFDGGPGQIALHGRGNLGGILGTAVSHGCIRFGGRAITWLADHVPQGAPVTIV
jgi:lipoprotein-anchoring transpeptidase ErfK/SrfK